MRKKSKFGFSLIELSMVVLIIGILVVGVSQGSRIVKEAKIKSARSLTFGSPVHAIPNIVFWVETTLAQSFDSNIGDGNVVANWYDLNSQSTTKNNAVASGSPTYTANVLNGLPVIRFENDDGSNDFFTFDGSSLLNSNYTIFLVSARRSNQSTNVVIGGSAGSNFINLHVGYFTTKFRAAHYGDGVAGTDYIDYTIPAYTVPQYRIHSVFFDSIIGKSYYQDGGAGGNPTAQVTSAASKTALVSWAGASIGRFVTNYFDGDVAEVIIFNRRLTYVERRSVEQYLSQKWGIKLG